MKIQFEELRKTLQHILLEEGFPLPAASRIAIIFSESSLDGYHSHGVNRFGEFIKNVRKGLIIPPALPECLDQFGSVERWTGNQGAGPNNAWICMEKAISLAKDHVMGCVALQNTNHWMRGGTYGWQAARAGCIAICFTNTMPNMPPWGGTTPTTGNNPIIIGVPRAKGHIVMDISLSQFSYGKLWQHKLKGKELPFPGGYDQAGNMTKDPSEIIITRRILQTGYWKGSGLSMMIDLLAALLSGGKSTADIGKLEAETALSQVFLCIDPSQLNDRTFQENLVDKVVSYFKSSETENQDDQVFYPGEQTEKRRGDYLENGIPIDDEIWKNITELRK